MRISDWSSDVCSSDLVREAETRTSGEIVTIAARSSDHYLDMVLAWGVLAVFLALATLAALPPRMVERLHGAALGWQAQLSHDEARSEERRVGEEGVSTVRSRWSPYH